MAIREARKYTHEQATAATTWTITHNLGLDYPVVDCFVDNGGPLEKTIPYSMVITSPTVVTITWTSARAGMALVA